MCLVTNTSIPIILDKDLVVYKVLYKVGSRIYSIYQDYRYNIGKIYYNEELGIEPVYRKGQGIIIGYCVHEAYHACTTLYGAKEHRGKVREYRIYKCIIPKGSKVFFDRYCDEIASDTIIIKRRLLFNRF